MKVLLVLGTIASWLIAFGALFIFSATVFGQTIGGIFMLNGTLCLVGYGVVDKLEDLNACMRGAAKPVGERNGGATAPVAASDPYAGA